MLNTLCIKLLFKKAAEKHCNTFEAVSGVGVVIVLYDHRCQLLDEKKLKKQYQLRDFCGGGAPAGVQYGLGRNVELLYRFDHGEFFVLAGLAFQVYDVVASLIMLFLPRRLSFGEDGIIII